MTEPTYSMAQLAQILSALENQRRNPNSRQTAMKAIERSAAALGLSTADVFAAADGLLDGRIDADAWRAQLFEPAEAATDRADTSTSAEPAADEVPVEPAAAEPAIGVRQQLLAACHAAEQWLLAEFERPGEARPDAILSLLRAAIERAEGGRKLRPARPAGEPRSPRDPRAPRENSKEAQLIGLLRRPEGATVAQIVTATGWQAHTVRGAFAGALKKRRGLNVVSEKPQGGERVYRLAD